MEEFEKITAKMREYEKKYEKYNKFRIAFFKKYFKYYHRYEVIGLENIPDGPALIAVNHGGGFDLDIVSLKDCTHPDREIHPLIVETWHLLNNPWGKYWVGGGIPLWTRGGIRWEYIDPYLDKNGKHFPALVAIYPEGHSGTFKERRILHKFFPGVVRIALKYKVPIIPAAMIGFHKASPILFEIERDHTPNDGFGPLPFPLKLKAEFGAPIDLKEYYDRILSRAEEFWIANEIVRPKVAEILRKHADVVLGEVDVEMARPAR